MIAEKGRTYLSPALEKAINDFHKACNDRDDKITMNIQLSGHRNNVIITMDSPEMQKRDRYTVWENSDGTVSGYQH